MPRDSGRLTLPGERPGRPAPPELAEQRAQMQALRESGTWQIATPPREERLGGVRVLRFAPPDGPVRGRVLQLHGGGYRIGLPEMEAAFSAALAGRCCVEVVAPAYRLAPEHPFPAGLSDAWAVLGALASEDPELPRVVCGDSAGGGLAAGVGVLAAQHGLRLDALVLLSPWLDLTVKAPSYAAGAATDPLFSRESAEAAAELYLQGWAAQHPLASPLFAPLEGLPPTLVSVGSGEVLADDARGIHAALVSAGVASELCEIPGMEHVAVVRDRALAGAAETFERITDFIRARCAARGAPMEDGS